MLWMMHNIFDFYIFALFWTCFLDLIADIRNWIRNIEQNASDNVNKILVGNKADMDESKRAVPTSKGQALADEYGIKFFETSAKTNLNVEEVFFSIAKDIKQRLTDTDSRAEIRINKNIKGLLDSMFRGDSPAYIQAPNGGSGGHLDQPSHVRSLT
ncbi:hypothetical protein IGI04_023306 [Brassica rapa subsp. trilocularis]|uniref:Uncharacterized protein n=1 Tax=Brassica rapa subsp. trilocularis TaxID=1813537 RepID=A0ABQ7M5M6_BRACM|nr:hypothetical protein IGI04_023306 [Brassica rapa subsp. trilocularis]